MSKEKKEPCVVCNGKGVLYPDKTNPIKYRTCWSCKGEGMVLVKTGKK